LHGQNYSKDYDLTIFIPDNVTYHTRGTVGCHTNGRKYRPLDIVSHRTLIWQCCHQQIYPQN